MDLPQQNLERHVITMTLRASVHPPSVLGAFDSLCTCSEEYLTVHVSRDTKVIITRAVFHMHADFHILSHTHNH